MVSPGGTVPRLSPFFRGSVPSMRVSFCLLVAFSVSSNLTAAPPDAEKSAVALAELKAAVDGKPSSLEELAAKPFPKSH